MAAEEITALALRSMAAGDAADVTARALALAVSKQVPRCMVGISLGVSVLETARAGAPFALAKQEFMRLVSTGNLPYDPLALPPPHRNRWVEPLLGFLDPARYANSPVGRLMAGHGLSYFGRHFVCHGERMVATVGAWLPQGIARFSDQEVAVLSSSATALGPLLRLHAVATLGAAFEVAVMRDAEQRQQAAFLVGPTGAVLAASPVGDALLAGRPALRAHVERIGSQPLAATVERVLPTLRVRLCVTPLPTAPQGHRLVTATPLEDDGAASLTSRQSELLDHVENGLNNREIGIVMGLSPATVKTMLQRLYERTGTAGRLELVKWRRAGSRV